MLIVSIKVLIFSPSQSGPPWCTSMLPYYINDIAFRLSRGSLVLPEIMSLAVTLALDEFMCLTIVPAARLALILIVDKTEVWLQSLINPHIVHWSGSMYILLFIDAKSSMKFLPKLPDTCWKTRFRLTVAASMLLMEQATDNLPHCKSCAAWYNVLLSTKLMVFFLAALMGTVNISNLAAMNAVRDSPSHGSRLSLLGGSGALKFTTTLGSSLSPMRAHSVVDVTPSPWALHIAIVLCLHQLLLWVRDVQTAQLDGLLLWFPEMWLELISPLSFARRLLACGRQQQEALEQLCCISLAPVECVVGSWVGP